jgi:hypothetical protein
VTEYRKNGFEDEDFLKQLLAIEELEAEQRSIRAKAASECGKLAKRIKNEKATAKALGIPPSILSASLKTRKLERQIEAVAADIDEDLIEVWEDAAGQFSMFAPGPDEEQGRPEPTAQKAARKASAAKRKQHETEQEEGAAALEEIGSVH